MRKDGDDLAAGLKETRAAFIDVALEGGLTMKRPEYVALSDSDYQSEAAVLQSRIAKRRQRGVTVTSNQLWAWIKRRQPAWQELDWEKEFQRVEL